MSSVAPWTAHDTQLLFSVSLGLAIIIALISGLKIVPFFSILIGTFVTGLVAGVPADKLGFNFTQGAGHLLGDAGIIIALGAMLGALLTIGAGGGLKQTLIAAGISDAGFWMVREYFDLNLVQTIKVWSVLQTIVSIIGLIMVLLLWNLFS
jgi:GntP family gluconate:H+ symporter